MPGAEWAAVVARVAGAAGDAAGEGGSLLDDAYAPMLYELAWTIAGALLAFAVVFWLLLVPMIARLRGTRRVRRVPPPVVVPVPTVTPEEARTRAWEAIDAVERGVHDRRLSVRDAHLRLSAVLREYTTQIAGVDAAAMTLSELQAAGLTVVATAVATYYPIAFAPDEGAGLGAAAETARGVLRSWP